MQKTTVNPNPEQEMTVNPFAQEQAAEIQPQENAQTYPVEVDGDIVELTLEELIDAAAGGLSSATPTSAVTARQTRCRTARSTPLSSRNIRCPSEDIPQQVWEWAQQEGSLVSAYRKWGDCRTERRTGSTRDEPEEPPCGGRSGAVGRGTRGGRPGYARFARQVTFSLLHDLTFI